MRLPVIVGLIRRRILVNYRVDADVVQRLLPAPLRPKLHAGRAIAGICLIRLEQIRPKFLPRIFGISSENAAHRIAVEWTDEANGETREGVYIPRRDTSAWLNHLAGGRVFPGEHHYSRFRVHDADGAIEMNIRSSDGGMTVELQARETESFPADSVFDSLRTSSAFFEKGSVGFSATSDCCRLDGLRLHTKSWHVRPLQVEHVASSFFSDETLFPEGSVAFDHALIMRDIPHEWHGVPDMSVQPQAAGQEVAAGSATGESAGGGDSKSRERPRSTAVQIP